VESLDDEQQEKRPNTFRVGFDNIYNLPEDRRTSKSRQLIHYIVHKSYDCFCMVEIRINWKKMEHNNRWFERIWGKLNVTELSITKALQPGSVGMITSEEVTHRVTGMGKDPTELGRWCWMHLQGRKSDFAPCEALYENLYPACSEWLAAGDQLIIGIDANEDVSLGQTAAFFVTLGMKEAILTRLAGKSPPATSNRNTRRQPINGLFVTPGLHAVAAGYEAFGVGCPSDHRVLWADFKYATALGFNSLPVMRPKIRRLNTKNPRMVEKYVQAVRKALVQTGIAKRLFALEAQADQDGWSAKLQAEYNDIQTLQLKIRILIEYQLCKLGTGGDPWSPRL
jgi:hypothetical protein